MGAFVPVLWTTTVGALRQLPAELPYRENAVVVARPARKKPRMGAASGVAMTLVALALMGAYEVTERNTVLMVDHAWGSVENINLPVVASSRGQGMNATSIVVIDRDGTVLSGVLKKGGCPALVADKRLATERFFEILAKVEPRDVLALPEWNRNGDLRDAGLLAGLLRSRPEATVSFAPTVAEGLRASRHEFQPSCWYRDIEDIGGELTSSNMYDKREAPPPKRVAVIVDDGESARWVALEWASEARSPSVIGQVKRFQFKQDLDPLGDVNGLRAHWDAVLFAPFHAADVDRVLTTASALRGTLNAAITLTDDRLMMERLIDLPNSDVAFDDWNTPTWYANAGTTFADIADLIATTRDCYVEGRFADLDIQGELTLELHRDLRGAMTAAPIGQTTIAQSVAQCTVDRLGPTNSRWNIPRGASARTSFVYRPHPISRDEQEAAFAALHQKLSPPPSPLRVQCPTMTGPMLDTKGIPHCCHDGEQPTGTQGLTDCSKRPALSIPRAP